MKEKARQYLLSIGYDEASVEETIANATEEELRELVPADVPKAKPKPKPRRNPNPPEYKRPADVKLKLSSNMVDIPIKKPVISGSLQVAELLPVKQRQSLLSVSFLKKQEYMQPRMN